MSSAWLHPLTRASRALSVRLMALERAMPTNETDLAAWPHWAAYVATCEALARCVQLTRGATWAEASGEAPRRRVGKVG